MKSRREFLKCALGASVVMVLGACTSAPAAAPTSAPAAKPTDALKPAEAKPAAPAPAASPAAAGESTKPAASPAAAVAPASKPAGPLKPVRIGVAGAFLPLAQVFIAKNKGYYAEMGVDVQDIRVIISGISAIVAGELDVFAAGATDVLLIAEKGEVAQSIVCLTRDIEIHLEVHPESARQRGVTPSDPIEKRLASMKGMTIAAAGAGTAPDVVLDAMIRQATLQPAEVTKRFIAAQPAQLAALEQRQVDAIIGGPPLTDALVKDQKGVILIQAPEIDVLKNVVYENAYGMKKWVDGHPDEARGVARALAKANQFMLNDPTAAQFLNQTEFNAFPADVIETSLKRFRTPSGIPADGKVTQAQWEATVKYALAAGLITKTYDMAEGTYWTNRYLS